MYGTLDGRHSRETGWSNQLSSAACRERKLSLQNSRTAEMEILVLAGARYQSNRTPSVRKVPGPPVVRKVPSTTDRSDRYRVPVPVPVLYT